MHLPRFVTSLLALPLSFCSTQTDRVLYKTTCRGDELTLIAIDPGALQNHKVYTELRAGNRPPIRPKDRFLPHGLPYDTELYGRSPWKLLDTTTTYSRKNQSRFPRDRVMIYLDPKVYSEQDFIHIYQCLSTHAAALVQAMDVAELTQDYQFAGIVLGNAADFTQRFSKRPTDYIDILPDGTIEYTTDQNREPEGVVIYTFAGDKVHMPGRRILIDDPRRAVKMNLHDYRNKAGQALDEVFAVSYSPTPRP